MRKLGGSKAIGSSAQRRKAFAPNLWQSVLLCSLGAFMWGFSGTCSQYLYEHYVIDPLFISCVRGIVAMFVFMGVVLLRNREPLMRAVRDVRSVASFIVFGIGLYASQVTYLTSVSWTNAGTATVLQMASSALIVVFASIAAKKLPRAREVAGVVAAIVGTWLIATQGDPGVLSIPPQGLFWGVANALAVTLYIMWPKKLFARFGSFTSTGIGMVVCCVIGIAAWLCSAFADGFGAQAHGFDTSALLIRALPSMDAFGWLLLVGGMGFLGSFVALTFYLYGVARVGSVKGGMLGAFEPLGAIVVSAIWLGTSFSGYDWGGFALMVVMLALVTFEPSRKRSRF